MSNASKTSHFPEYLGPPRNCRKNHKLLTNGHTFRQCPTCRRKSSGDRTENKRTSWRETMKGIARTEGEAR